MVRGATAALHSGTLAMLDEGVGAALAGASEARATGGLDRLSGPTLRADLRRALVAGEFELHYQPQISTSLRQHPLG